MFFLMLCAAAAGLVGGVWLLQGCATSGKAAMNADRIADALRKKLQDELNGRVSELMSQSFGDGDANSEADEEDEYCDDEDGEYCTGNREEPEFIWPEEDFDGQILQATHPGVPPSPAPTCVSDIESCQRGIAPGDEDLVAIGSLDLGWFAETPPAESGGPETTPCFESPVLLSGADVTVLTMAYDADWLDVAALVFVINGIDGYALLPIDKCGAFELPGFGALCDGLSSGEIVLPVRGALITFSRAVGPYTDFSLVIRCR